MNGFRDTAKECANGSSPSSTSAIADSISSRRLVEQADALPVIDSERVEIRFQLGDAGGPLPAHGLELSHARAQGLDVVLLKPSGSNEVGHAKMLADVSGVMIDR
jgi:hypothetical protein